MISAMLFSKKIKTHKDFRCGFLLSGTLFLLLCILSLSLAGLFSYQERALLNVQKKNHLEQSINILSLNIHGYLKRKARNEKPPKSGTLHKMVKPFQSPGVESVFLINSSGRLMVHTEKSLIGETLPLNSSMFSWLKPIVKDQDSYHNHYLFFSNQVHSKRQNSFLRDPKKKTDKVSSNPFPKNKHTKVHLEDSSHPEFSISTIRLVKKIFVYEIPYYLIIEGASHKWPDLFLSHLPFTVPPLLICFILILAVLFSMYRPQLQAGEFFYKIFCKPQSPSNFKKTLAFLTHTKNPYLSAFSKDIKKRLAADPPASPSPSSVIYKEPKFSDIIQKAYRQGQMMFPNTQFKIQCQKDLPLPVFSDLVFQAIWELIKNSCEALSYNAITISTFHKDTWFCCQIEDQGPGIHQSVLSKAGRLYFTTKKNAAGLGLSFVQKVLLRFGGMVKLKSTPGKGLNVRLFIPLDYMHYIQKLRVAPARTEEAS